MAEPFTRASTRSSVHRMEKIAEIRERFNAQLDMRLRELGEAVSDAVSARDNTDCMASLDVLIQLSHKLYSAAITFGIHNLAAAASNLENYTTDLRGQNKPIDEQAAKVLQGFFLTLAKQGSGHATAPDDSGDPGDHARHPEVANDQLPEQVKRTVYMVDSDKHFTRMMHDHLKHFGYDALTIHDYSSLEAAMQTLVPAAIIIDVEAPDNTVAGLEVVDALKSRGILNCPVLYVSARDDAQARLGAVRAGGDGYLVKPVDIIELVDLLDHCTGKSPDQAMSVVIVDDAPDVTGFPQRLFSEAGLQTHIITNPPEAYDRIIELKPDVIVLNMEMPGYSGFDLAKMIRQNKVSLTIPIIFMSGTIDDETRTMAMRMGCSDFLSRDIEPQVLLASVLARGNRARDLKSAINHLFESKNRFRAVAETAQESIITTDERGQIVYWNQGAEVTFGYPLSDALGMSLFSLLLNTVIDGRSAGAIDVLGDTKKFGSGKVIEATGVARHGRTFPVEMTVAGWTIDQHRYFTSIIRDTTVQSTAERALSQAKLEAELANEIKSDFLTSMSHELRTPLNAILGFAQLMQIDPDNPLSGSQIDSVEQIARGGNYLLNIINEILDLAKIEAGKITLSIQSINPESALEQCITLVEVMANERAVEIDTSNFQPEHNIMADPLRFKQVLLNLMSNAVKYNRVGGRVTIESILSDNHAVRFSVRDTGKGIHEADLPNLFKPFHRLGEEGKATEGTGIGLTITKRLVEAMNGEVGVYSTPGTGSTFWVDFPLSTEVAETEELTYDEEIVTGEQTIGDMASVGVDTDVATILYVEDNTTNVQLMEMLFAQFENRQLVIASSAEKGLAMARDIMPDAILMDINLPGMSGLEALDEIKSDSEIAHIPVIAVTAAAAPRDFEKGMNAGFYAYITKPFSVTDIIATTSNAIAGSTSPDP